MGKYIDRTPPTSTGDQKKDAQAVFDYLNYLREQMNYILSLIYRQQQQ